jgi:WD40 repeat protein
MTMRGSFSLIAFLLSLTPLAAQPTKIPTADEVKALQAKYNEEREIVVKNGIAKRFIPAIMEKAEELAKKSNDALASGRLLQATEAIRQARWQLPYQPIGVPEHVSRIIGNLRLRHSREINALVFSPDGTKLATASSDETVKIWDLGNGHDIVTFAGHKDKVRCLAWSSDGAFIVSAGQEKNIKIWDAKTGKEIKNIVAVGELVSSIALSKDGKHIFSGQLNVPGNPPNGLFVYETQTGKLVREVRDFTNKIGTLALNNDGTILAAGDDNGNVRLFSFPSFIENANQPAYWTQQDAAGATYHLSFSPDGKTLVRVGPLGVKLYNTPVPNAPFQVAQPRITINTNGPRTAVYSRDGKTLFTGDFDGNIILWDPENGQRIGEYKKSHNSPINQLVFSPGGDRLASCSGDFAVRLIDFDIVLQSRDFEGHDAPVWTAAFSPNGTKLLSASADKTVKVWQRDSGKVLFTITDHTAPVTCAQFSTDGKLIASAGGDKIVRIFDAADAKPLRKCEGHTGTITFLDFSADSKRIVSCGADRKIIIWDADTAKPLTSITDNPSIVAAVAFHPNGKQIAVGNIDQTIRLYDVSGKLQHSWNAHGIAVNGVAYSPNGQFLASCGADMSVAVWPLTSPGANGMRLSGHTGPVSMVAFRKDNIHLVSCGADQTIKLWKVEGNAAKELQTFRGHKDWVTSVAFSKDGYHVVSASVDRKLKIWEITSRDLPLLAEHTSAVETVAVSPNGEIIATGSVDRTIKLWNRKTGEEIATLTGHPEAVMAMVFTPDSKRIVSSGSDAKILLWNVSPPQQIQRNDQQLKTLDRLRRYSPYIALDEAGKTLFVWLPLNDASTSSIVEVIDLDTGAFRYEFKEDGSRKVNSLAFSANGKWAASGGKNGSVRVWEMGQDNAKVERKEDWNLFKVGVADLALTPDGSILVTSSDDGEIKIGKVKEREEIKSFKGHEGRILNCITSPDGKYFATVGADNIIKAWDMTGKELRRWDVGRHQGMFVINLAFTPDSRQIVTANANTTVYVLDLP